VPAGQFEEILALSIVFFVHVVGGIMLLWGILDDEGREPWRRRFRRGSGGDEPPRDPQPSPGGDHAPLPLGDAAPSRVRLREDGRIAERYPPPARRPADPAPDRTPAPAPD
jgi:hypothetical protein